MNCSTGEVRINASSLSIGGEAAATKSEAETAGANGASTYYSNLTQKDIFNKLTNNGVDQGIKLVNNKIYINASYINTGEFSVSKLNANGTTTETFYVNTSTGTVRINASSIKISGDSLATESYADTASSNYFSNMSQATIFDKLTGGGKKEGLFMENGKLYLNASYLSAGTLAGPGNNTTFNLATGELNIGYGSIDLGNFHVDSDGNVAIGATKPSDMTSFSNKCRFQVRNTGHLKSGDIEIYCDQLSGNYFYTGGLGNVDYGSNYSHEYYMSFLGPNSQPQGWVTNYGINIYYLNAHHSLTCGGAFTLDYNSSITINYVDNGFYYTDYGTTTNHYLYTLDFSQDNEGICHWNTINIGFKKGIAT